MEKWKPIPGWRKYYDVSNLGRVKSKRWGGRILKPCRGTSVGYLLVGLNVGKRKKSATVHRLVLLAFKGKPPKGHECCHKNGIRTDNRLVNLRWGTSKSNAADRIKHGNVPNFKGENSYAAKLSDKRVRFIRRYAGKFSQRQMGKMFGVSHNTIGYVIRGEGWAHVK